LGQLIRDFFGPASDFFGRAFRHLHLFPVDDEDLSAGLQEPMGFPDRSGGVIQLMVQADHEDHIRFGVFSDWIQAIRERICLINTLIERF
jgi:hypothetical protein